MVVLLNPNDIKLHNITIQVVDNPPKAPKLVMHEIITIISVVYHVYILNGNEIFCAVLEIGRPKMIHPKSSTKSSTCDGYTFLLP